MKRNQKGIAFINLILTILIIICGIILLASIYGKGEENVAQGDTSPIYENYTNSKKTYTIENTQNEYVALDNSIMSNMQGNVTTANSNEGIGYYYNQLTQTGKQMYDTVIRNIDSLIDGYKEIEFSINENDAGNNFQAVWDAISLDRPDIFWVDTYKISLITRATTMFFNSTNYKYRLEPKEGQNYFLDTFENSSEVKDAIIQVQSVVNNIVSKCNGSTYNKVRTAHEEIINNIEYDQTENPNNSNLYGALIEKRCVCEGYAEAFKAVLDKLNIPCVIVYGNGIDSNGNTEAHAWNYVKMDDGNWYGVDATWDDPIIIGNGRLPEASKYKYFLKGKDSFSQNHIEDGDVSGTGQKFKYPQLANRDFE